MPQPHTPHRDKPLMGGRMLPVRCWYCNRFISHHMEELLRGQSIDAPYCCKSFYVTTQIAMEE